MSTDPKKKIDPLEEAGFAQAEHEELLGEFASTIPHHGADHPGYADTVIDAPEDRLRFLVTTDFDDAVLDMLRTQGEVRVQPYLPSERPVFKRALANADVVFVSSATQIDNETLQDCKRLKVIACTEDGHQNIDPDACRRRGIQIITAPEGSAQSVAEYVLSTMMILSRGLFTHTRIREATTAGKWARDEAMNGHEIFGATLGLVGFQDMASQRVAFLAQALGMRVVVFDPGIAMDDPSWIKRALKPLYLADLLRTSDVVSLHLPRSVHSRHLLDRPALSTMKKGAILISACAGGVLDEPALVDMLRSGHLCGAALDVFDREPLPEVGLLKECPNLLLSPHVAGVTQESQQRVARTLVEKVFKTLDLDESTASSAA